MGQLPNKLSAIIDHSLEDLEVIEQNPLYEIVMEDWHEPNIWSGKCEVCLGGAVMANTLKVDPSMSVYPWHLPSITVKNKLMAIDHIRKGNVGMALYSLGNHSVRQGKTI